MRRVGLTVTLACLAVGIASAAPAAPPVAAAPPAPVPLSITVFDQENFKGRSVKISAATPNLATMKFEDKVASFEVAGAGDWVLCENRNYGGRCARVQAKAADLRIIQLFARVSSLYPVPAPAVVPAAPATPK
ncbi:MAG: beta/gamma crystallin-related protein [Micropepsaceae bacterium]